MNNYNTITIEQIYKRAPTIKYIGAHKPKPL